MTTATLKVLELTMVIPGEFNDPEPQQEPSGEDDNLVTLHPQASSGPTEKTQKMTIVNPAETLRNFYPRKGDRVGTRLLFVDKSALAVVDTYEQVVEKLTALYA